MKKLLALAVSACLLLAVGCSTPAAAPAGPAPEAAAPEAAAPEAATPEAAAPEAAKKDGGWTIAYLCKDLSQQWFIDVSGSLEKTAKELGAKEVIMCDSGMDPEKYMKDLDNMISQKVDLIIVCPPDQQLSQVTVDRCAAAGIPVFADADGLITEGGDLLAPVLQLDAYKVGEGIGEWLGNYVNDHPELTANMDEFGFMLMTMNEVSSCVPRHEGARDMFNKTSKVAVPAEKIIPTNYDGTPEKGYEVAAATITANPQIKYWVVTAPNDEGAMGATRALEQAGKDKNATVVGCGAYHAKDEFKKEYSAMKAASYFDPIQDGIQIATAGIELLKNGKEVFGEYKADGATFGVYPLSGTMVTVENYKEVMGSAAE